MSASNIDELNIEISASSTSADAKLDELISSLTTLARQFNNTSTSGKSTANAVKNVGNAAKQTAADVNKISLKNIVGDTSLRGITSTITGLRTIKSVASNVFGTLNSWFAESSEYIEDINLFRVEMGDAADEALRFANIVSDKTGIDVKEWIRFQGMFKQLTVGFGQTEENANTMSQQLTQVAYDLSSLFDAPVETAFNKLSSAMAGQVKGLYQWGISTTVASLQEYALSKGIDGSVRSMTQAQKTMLRYNYIIEQTTKMQGDMTKTLASPANAMRILEAQIKKLRRALGDIISVFATRIIPYMQVAIRLAVTAANAIAKLFGYEETDFGKDDDSTDSLVSGFEDAEDAANGTAKAAKEIRKQLMGFDELNILKKPDDSSADAGGVMGGDPTLGMKPLEYDFLKNLEEPDYEGITNKLKKIAAGLLGVSSALGTISLAKKLGKGMSYFDVPKGMGAFVDALGIGAGLALQLYSGLNMISGIDLKDLALYLGGAALSITCMTDLFGPVQGGILGIVSAAALLALSIKDINENGLDLENTLGLIASVGLVGISVGLMTTSPLIGVIAAAVAALGVAIYLIVTNWDEVKKKVTEVVDTCKEKIDGFIDGVKGVFQGIKDFIVNSVLYQILAEEVKQIKEIVTGVYEAIASIVEKIVEIVAKIIEIGVAIWGAIKTYVIKPVVDKISQFNTFVYNKIVKPVVDLFSGLFKKVYDLFSPYIKLIKDKLVGIGTDVVDFVGGLFKSVINGVLYLIEGRINSFIGMLNLAIGIINGIPGVKITTVDRLHIPKLADGGALNQGQMFIAKEAGPELVGNIGNTTAVMNNGQIVEAVSQGVYKAVTSASANGKDVNINATFMMDGDVFSRQFIQYHNGKVRQTGKSPLLV